jgi:hypothetical protein
MEFGGKYKFDGYCFEDLWVRLKIVDKPARTLEENKDYLEKVVDFCNITPLSQRIWCV